MGILSFGTYTDFIEQFFFQWWEDTVYVQHTSVITYKNKNWVHKCEFVWIFTHSHRVKIICTGSNMYSGGCDTLRNNTLL